MDQVGTHCHEVGVYDSVWGPGFASRSRVQFRSQSLDRNGDMDMYRLKLVSTVKSLIS